MGDCRMNVRIGTLYTRRVNRRVEMRVVVEPVMYYSEEMFRSLFVCNDGLASTTLSRRSVLDSMDSYADLELLVR